MPYHLRCGRVGPIGPERYSGCTSTTEVQGRCRETVRVVDPLIETELARMVVLPGASPDANPMLLIVATAVFVELQVTELVRFCVLLSL